MRNRDRRFSRSFPRENEKSRDFRPGSWVMLFGRFRGSNDQPTLSQGPGRIIIIGNSPRISPGSNKPRDTAAAASVSRLRAGIVVMAVARCMASLRYSFNNGE